MTKVTQDSIKPFPCIIGPTACGKTSLAIELAKRVKGEIISADSRQIYKNMDIGTGKDLEEYVQSGITSHLIDIKEAGEKYSLFEFKNDCLATVGKILQSGSVPIICGGSGLYVESVLLDYDLRKVDEDKDLRKELSGWSMDELVDRLKSFGPIHNTTDTTDKDRLIRALEIAELSKNVDSREKHPYRFKTFGMRGDRTFLKNLISKRLDFRLNNGMVEEVESLLKSGVPSETLHYYGLEYRYVALFLNNELNFNDMKQKLRSAIFQFSKRQSTFFRRMEKRGIHILWLNFEWKMEDKLNFILERL